MKIFSEKTLKGGSLARTYIIETSHGTFVRKEININKNREYGYQRWYSQLKRLQRYDTLFPGLFAKVVRYGLSSDDIAYFDLEYYANSKNCFDYLSKVTDDKKITNLYKLINHSMETIHNLEINSHVNSLDLYFKEEVETKINHCLIDNDFKNFYHKKEINFNGKVIKSFRSLIEDFKKFGTENYINPIESYTHGNITLENIIYDEDNHKVIFVDPYEENIIDNIYNEYSQILQSCNSHYEIYNSLDVANFENIAIKVPYGIAKFNEIFNSHLISNLNQNEINMVKYFEISQFIRMLPFKLSVDKNKMFLFYSLASYLTNKLIEE